MDEILNTNSGVTSGGIVSSQGKDGKDTIYCETE